MHFEFYTITKKEAEKINSARREGRRIIPVGTTVIRTLETSADKEGYIQPGTGKTDLMIIPGYRFKCADAMITNFHLPRSTLLMLVCAFGGTSLILEAYKEAIKRRYRFYSYGDAMFIQ
jgi:S-adenosylmethionine:tRNA ribosyltransferase-isomerase